MSDTDPFPGRRLARRFRAVALAAAALLAGTAGGLIPSPLAAEPAGAQPVPAGTPGVTRYFGRGAFDGIRAAVAATPRSCELSDDELTALVMAPIFKEVSQATSPETAPSPMTLSRWDEWSGVPSGSSNMNANYGLYAFSDPHTPYARAYWTPGIGIFQYDSAGVGAPFTAAELMDVQHVAGDVAAGMAGRYCAAGGDGYARRAAAWQPWGALGGIAKSEALFQEMMAIGTPAFARIGLVDGIEKGGGMQERTCITGGVTMPCWYIDPSRAQGANWWATSDPGGGAVGSGMAPLPAPFYVVKHDGFEVRHFMWMDTGYDINLVARRNLGANARPRDGQPGSGLVWAASSDLCDTSRPEMGCAPPPPPPPAPEPVPAAATGAGSGGAPGEPAPVPAEPTPPGTPVSVEQLLAPLGLAADDVAASGVGSDFRFW